MTEEEKLYVVPSNLEGDTATADKLSTVQRFDGRGREIRSKRGFGGTGATGDAPSANDELEQQAMLGGTGIMEVDLPVEYKLANIEATERARQQMRDAQQRKKPRAAFSSSVGGSVSANFSQHGA